MRTKYTIVAAGMFGAIGLLLPREVAAQTSDIPVAAEHDTTWGTVSHVSLAIGASTVFLMPRVYYSDPESTVGWKGRWHVSMLAPAMTMTALTFLVDFPIKNALESTRPGCTFAETQTGYGGCESFGGPSTHAFASWGATGTGLGIFLVDTLKYSNGRFSAPGFVGNVAVPLVASIFTSVGRGVDLEGNKEPYESAGQIAAGTVTGFLSGLAVGAAYAALQRPSCGYGDALFCW